MKLTHMRQTLAPHRSPTSTTISASARSELLPFLTLPSPTVCRFLQPIEEPRRNEDRVDRDQFVAIRVIAVGEIGEYKPARGEVVNQLVQERRHRSVRALQPRLEVEHVNTVEQGTGASQDHVLAALDIHFDQCRG